MIHHLHHHRRIHRRNHQSRRSHQSQMSHRSHRNQSCHRWSLRRLQLGRHIHIRHWSRRCRFRLHIGLRLGWRGRRCNHFRLHQMNLHRHRCGLRFWLTRLRGSTWLGPRQRFGWIISWSFLHMNLRHLLIRSSCLQGRLQNRLRRLLRRKVFLIIKQGWLGWLRSSWNRLRCHFPSRRFLLLNRKFIRLKRLGLRSGWRHLQIGLLRFIPSIRSISQRSHQ